MTLPNRHPSVRPAPVPPVAPKIPKETLLHGEVRLDDYFWLRDKGNPEVTAYLGAENSYTDAVMKPTEPFQEALYQEMLARIKQTDLGVPYFQDGYFYYSRTEEGKQYPIYCRRKGAADAPEEITLDVNALAMGEAFMAIGVYAVSDDGRWLAYSADNTGFRQYTLRIKDLLTGDLLAERIEKVVTLAWANDNNTLFYVTEDSSKRPSRLFRHLLRAQPDELIFEEPDERFRVSVEKSLSKAFLFLSCSSHTTSEVRYLSSNRPQDGWSLISPRHADHEYDVDHHADSFYIRTNSAGRNFRLVSAPVAAPGQSNWKEIIPHRADVMLEGMMFFANHSVLFEREDGLQQFRVTDLRSGESHHVRFPEPTYTALPSSNRNFHATKFRYSYTSFITPNSVFDYDMDRRESQLLKRTEVLGGYDPEQYDSERLFASAADGIRIPVSLVYRKGLQKDSSAPMLLTGYGAYGFPYSASFSSNRVSLLDRGVVFAIAHVRGGGEMGKPWHDQGRMLRKKNTFTDFIAAAEFLLEQKFTARDRLVIQGGSAGGLLAGAVLNMRPDLFKAVVALVPFVDVVNSMLDESLPLTVGEFEEWGNPRKREEYLYIKSYCPYSNLDGKLYPNILIRTSLNDSQVMYWEPAKYVARLRSIKKDSNLLLLKTNMAAGHGGSSGRYDLLREIAFDYAFILNQVGISD